jgi:exodeoxyribonuclease VII small subunit
VKTACAFTGRKTEAADAAKFRNFTAMTYESAYNELQAIISDIESGEISVDLLSEKVKRAAELIAFCKEKLTSTESDVQKILDDLSK